MYLLYFAKEYTIFYQVQGKLLFNYDKNPYGTYLSFSFQNDEIK